MYIYKLSHPSSDKIYIGKTSDIKLRLNRHIKENGVSPKNSWIKNLVDNGLRPEISII